MYRRHKMIERIDLGRTSTYENNCAIHTDLTTRPWLNIGAFDFHPVNWHEFLRFLKRIDENTAHRSYTDALNNKIYISAIERNRISFANDKEVFARMPISRLKTMIGRLEKSIRELGLN